MASYIDGFALPIARNRLADYKALVEAAAAIWIEHGALRYREYVGEGLKTEGTRSFQESVNVSNDDVIVFGWVEFESRAARDKANARVASDPRMAGLIEASGSGFDAARMAYGSFELLVQASSSRPD